MLHNAARRAREIVSLGDNIPDVTMSRELNRGARNDLSALPTPSREVKLSCVVIFASLHKVACPLIEPHAMRSQDLKEKSPGRSSITRE